MSVDRMHQWVGAATRVLRAAAPLFGVVLAGQAQALGLGEPSVASVLGQPLKMTVPLVLEPGAELPQECIRIVPSGQAADPIPSLNVGRASVDVESHQLRIESLQAITEPALRVVVELGCNQRIRREFALLLDPPSMTADAVAAASGRGSESSIGLGLAQISAVLGQRLSLKVPVAGTAAAGLSADCVHLADPISSEGAPVLRQADIRVLPRETGALIEVVTPSPVTEPAVRLALDVGCDQPLRREYAILLGLPSLAATNLDTAAPAAEPPPPAPAAKPAPKHAARAPRVVTAVPVTPAPASKAQASTPPAEAARKAAPAAAPPGSDRLVLASPDDQARPAAFGGDTRGAAPDPTAELLRRLDAMSKQMEALQAQLDASRRREQELRSSFETREQWTWSMGGLGGLLLGGALVMAWRQRRPALRPTWEPVVRPAQAGASRAAATVQPGAAMAAREAPGIGGRATMAPAPNTVPAVTEPSMSDGPNSEITVTELHDTVQVIKELYATVLERNTSSATAGSNTGRPQRPLELDLKAPTRAGLSTVSPRPADDRAAADRPQSARSGARSDENKRALEERFTELPTEVGLDLDLSSIVGSTVAGDLHEPPLLRGGDRSPPQEARTAPAAGAPKEPLTPAAAGAAPAQGPAAVPAPAARRAAEPPEEELTQTPTEVMIDIDVGTTTGFSSTISRPTRGAQGKRTDTERSGNTSQMLDPIDLQLDLNQPDLNSRPRRQRSG